MYYGLEMFMCEDYFLLLIVDLTGLKMTPFSFFPDGICIFEDGMDVILLFFFYLTLGLDPMEFQLQYIRRENIRISQNLCN